MIGGFETPTSGRILVEGNDQTSTPPNRRNVNMVFQDYALFPHLTVARNVAFGLQMKGWPSGDIARSVAELLALVRLESYGERAPHELSGGQRQRVALARALAPNPPVLLLDEPLGALDAKLRREMQSELRRLQRTTGKTFILVTHDQEEALTMSDTVVVMNNGKIEQAGTPEELYNAPRTAFVARFIGEMNFFDGVARTVQGGIVEFDWHGTPMRARLADVAAQPGGAVSAAVRPEYLAIHASRPAGARNAIAGRIEERIFRGTELRYVVKAGDMRVDISSRDPDATSLPDDVWVSWEPERMFLLEGAGAAPAHGEVA
jgi:spermidine/putrescine transport system ATP-binding protein